MRRTPRRTILALVVASATLMPVAGYALGDPHSPTPDQRARFTGPGFDAPRAPRSAHHTTTAGRWDDSPAVEQRVEAILAQMTNQEKADLATGELNNFYGFYNNPIARLGIPALTMADGPVGVRVANPNVDQATTQLPSGSALAATFDRKLARRYGAVLGEESLHTGHNVILGPTLDISRTPLWGRAFEGLGEDPLVSGSMGSQIVRGVQSHPVIATLKHPFAYNQETDRFDVDAQVDERTLREIYVRPFQIVQGASHPGAMMCSFNKVNGVHSCENPGMNSILKQDLGFRGFVMSDYNATPSTVQAAVNGLDQEQPGDQGPGTANFGERLVQAVQSGQVPQARLDDMARRILRPMVGLGLLDTPPTNSAWDKAANSATARTIASRAMVLLKNKGHVLPLRTGPRSSVAVIGPDADNISAQGGGSSEVSVPTRSVSPLQGIQAATRGPVSYEPGVDGISEGDLLTGPDPVPSSVLSPAAGDTRAGLSASYWGNTDFSGDPHLTQVDPNVNVNFGFQNYPGFNAASPKIPTVRGDFALLGDLSARWDGVLTAPATATYTLGLTARGDASLTLDGQPFVQHSGALSSVGRTISLQAGQTVAVHIQYAAPALNTYQGGQVRFFWEHPEQVMSPMMAKAVEQARHSRVAVVVVRDYETEGYDRPSLALPKEQEQLIRQVAAVNPRTVVVVETGSVSRVSPWVGGVASLVQAWFPGQEQGNAIADVLFGRVNPSGHLPATLPQDGQVPQITAGTAPLTEGVLVGYRGFDPRSKKPVYGFGDGLSYTHFALSRLRLETVKGSHGQVRVSFRVRNTGDRAGTAVPQVYVGRLPGKVATPWRQLVGFETVRLGPGTSKVVRIRVPREAIAYWSSTEHRWVMPHGKVTFKVGRSVLKTPLSGSLRLH